MCNMQKQSKATIKRLEYATAEINRTTILSGGAFPNTLRTNLGYIGGHFCIDCSNVLYSLAYKFNTLSFHSEACAIPQQVYRLQVLPVYRLHS
jgi:hypothetical protein